ncbi:MAG: TonB-dependent receptor [Gemmatimonadetes bacterium]|nr:TonB-dependent receptor [Gemmatimonadota bacterium]
MPRSVVRCLGLCAGVLALLLCLAPAHLAAQAGTIQGRVLDSAGTAIPGASVSLDRSTARATTDAAGKYTMRGVGAGSYTMRVRAIGYTPTETEVVVEGAGLTTRDIVMARTAVELAPIDVVVGSRARHTAAEELAVPVDVFTAEEIQKQGTTETSQILQALAPSVNFPRQSVTDANDIVRPFTLRGLSPDHTLVLVNGWRRHTTAVLNTFAYGMGAGSTGVDMNALPSGAVERIEVLRDGAAAQYGSDAIAGVVNLVLKEGKFSPFLTASGGQYVTGKGYKNDGTTVDLNGGVGIGLGRGSLALFGQFQQRDPTNRAWADPYLVDQSGVADSINPSNGQIVIKRNNMPQPNLHWGDGLEKNTMTFANFRMPLNPAGSSEVYAFGGYSKRVGTGNGYWRYFDSARNWPEIYPNGFLPEFRPDVEDYSAAGGIRTSLGGWAVDFGATYGANSFDYNLRNTLNASLGPSLTTPTAPGADGILGNADDPGIPNQTSFRAGSLKRNEILGAINFARQVTLGLPQPVNVAFGLAARREQYEIVAGERASWINGNHQAQDSSGAAPAGSSVFAGFSPTDASKNDRSNVGAYLDLETDLSPQFLANVAGRYEHYSDFGSQLTGKLALRYQPSRRLVVRGAASTGFRAPSLAQSYFSHVTTSYIAGQLVEVGNYPVNSPAARALGSKKLREEHSLNLSGGLAVTPRDNLTITVDVFHIKITDRILLGATFDDDTTLAILANAGITGVAGVQYFTNGLDTRTQGIDIAADLRVPAGAGNLGFNAAINYTRNQITHIDPIPSVLANSSEPGLIDTVTYIAITDERPDWRGTLTSTYDRGPFSTLVRASYYGKFSSAQPGFCDLCRENYGAKTLFDLEVSYRFQQTKVAIGARNIFDTYPDSPSSNRPSDPNDPTSDPVKLFNNNYGTFPWAAASPFGYNGRFLYSRVEMTLGW